MTFSDTLHVSLTTLWLGAVILGLGLLLGSLASLAVKVARHVKENRQAAANGKRLGLYLEVPSADEVAAAFRRQREAAAARKAAER